VTFIIFYINKFSNMFIEKLKMFSFNMLFHKTCPKWCVVAMIPFFFYFFLVYGGHVKKIKCILIVVLGHNQVDPYCSQQKNAHGANFWLQVVQNLTCLCNKAYSQLSFQKRKKTLGLLWGYFLQITFIWNKFKWEKLNSLILNNSCKFLHNCVSIFWFIARKQIPKWVSMNNQTCFMARVFPSHVTYT
jgi:hypothetical protein